MKSQSRVHQHKAAPATSGESISIKLSSGVGGRASSNDEHLIAQQPRAVDPLWMITVAMAFMFGLLAALVAFD